MFKINTTGQKVNVSGGDVQPEREQLTMLVYNQTPTENISSITTIYTDTQPNQSTNYTYYSF